MRSGTPLEEPASSWDALSEVDLMETYIGPGGVNSINSNFAGMGLARHWTEHTIVGGVHGHVTMWVDVDNAAGCPTQRTVGLLGGLQAIEYGKTLPVVSVYVARCEPGRPCCTGEGCKQLQSDPRTASACITVKEAPMLLSLSNWGSGHVATPGCELEVSDVRVRTT